MASTNKTPHLGLCQWEATDPFLREDMNGDFARIDAEISRIWAAIEGVCYKKLFSVTIAEPTLDVFMDFSDLDMTQFAELVLLFSFKSKEKSMRINGITDTKYVYGYTGGSENQDKMTVGSMPSRLVSVAAGLRYYILSGGNSYTLKNSSLSELKSIDIFGSSTTNNFAIGDRMTVWGVSR